MRQISRLWLLVPGAAVLSALVSQMGQLLQDGRMGGDEWDQADWLINMASGPVRRGPFGAALLHLSDVLGVAPVHLVIALQTMLIVAICVGVLWLLVRQRDAGFVLATLSPGFFALLWSIDPPAGPRKELLALLALLLLVLPGAARGRLVLSGALMVAGGWGHEVNVLLVPAWLVTLRLLPPATGRGWRLGTAALVGASAIAAAAHALSHARLANVTGLCAAISARGPLSEGFCDGAIGWLAKPDNGWPKVVEALGWAQYPWLEPAIWLAAILPPALLWYHAGARRGLGLGLVVAAAPLCLLYPVAVDWGRWMALQATVPALILLGLGATGRLALKRPLPVWLPAVCLLVLLGIGIPNSPGVYFCPLVLSLLHLLGIV